MSAICIYFPLAHTEGTQGAESVQRSMVSKFSGGRPGAIPITPPPPPPRVLSQDRSECTHTHTVEVGMNVSVSASTNGKCFDGISP